MIQQWHDRRKNSLGEDVQTPPGPPPEADLQNATPDTRSTSTEPYGTPLDNIPNGSQENRSSSSGSTSNLGTFGLFKMGSRHHQRATLSRSDTTESPGLKKRISLGPMKEHGVTKMHLPASHVFSADSRTILIWTEAELAIYHRGREFPDQLNPNIMLLRGIKYAAAGSECFGVIMEGEVSTLRYTFGAVNDY
jgi:hypothetical protein